MSQLQLPCKGINVTAITTLQWDKHVKQLGMVCWASGVAQFNTEHVILSTVEKTKIKRQQ